MQVRPVCVIAPRMMPDHASLRNADPHGRLAASALGQRVVDHARAPRIDLVDIPEASTSRPDP
jgi:hypothetical protein